MLLRCALSPLSEDLFLKLRSLNPRRHARREHAPRDPKNKLPQNQRTNAARAPKSKASTTKTNPYDDPKFASHVRYLSANNFADGFVPFIARVISSCVTRFAPINF